MRFSLGRGRARRGCAGAAPCEGAFCDAFAGAVFALRAGRTSRFELSACFAVARCVETCGGASFGDGALSCAALFGAGAEARGRSEAVGTGGVAACSTGAGEAGGFVAFGGRGAALGAACVERAAGGGEAEHLALINVRITETMKKTLIVATVFSKIVRGVSLSSSLLSRAIPRTTAAVGPSRSSLQT